MKSILKYYEKFTIASRYIVKYEIFEIDDLERYPDGIKFSFICFDSKTKIKILFDNHPPKGPHFHINEKEFKYKYISIQQLVLDLKKLVHKHMGVKI